MKLYDLSILFIILVIGAFVYPVYTTVKDCVETRQKEDFIDVPFDIQDEPPCCSYSDCPQSR